MKSIVWIYLSVCAIDDDIQNNTEFQGYFFTESNTNSALNLHINGQLTWIKWKSNENVYQKYLNEKGFKPNKHNGIEILGRSIRYAENVSLCSLISRMTWSFVYICITYWQLMWHKETTTTTTFTSPWFRKKRITIKMTHKSRNFQYSHSWQITWKCSFTDWARLFVALKPNGTNKFKKKFSRNIIFVSCTLLVHNTISIFFVSNAVLDCCRL